jgi:hypothetical protein
MQLFAIALLLAQPWISPIEQSYGPYSRPSRGGHHALAAGSSGSLLAWSETIDGAARIRIGLLDSRAQLISGIATLPLVTSGAEAYAPAVAFNGESFLVAWVEHYRGAERFCSMAVDGSGIPIPPAQRDGFAHGDDVTPLIVWDGTAWHVSDRSPTGVQAAAMNNGVYATVRWKQTPIYDCGRIAICGIRASRWDVVWTAGDESGSEQVGDEWPKGNTPPGMLAIAPAGDDFAIAWATSLGVGYLFTSARHSTTVHAYADDDAAPGLACDDERCVIAYGTFGRGDVQAIVVESDGVRGPELLTISATERKEHSALVHPLGSGRFLVSYLSDQTTANQRINGRIVSFEPARRRAVR